MTSNLQISNGTDFDDIFDSSGGNQLFYIYSSDGADIGQKYLPTSSGTAYGNVNYYNSNGIDIGTLLCKKGTSKAGFTVDFDLGVSECNSEQGIKIPDITIKFINWNDNEFPITIKCIGTRRNGWDENGDNYTSFSSNGTLNSIPSTKCGYFGNNKNYRCYTIYTSTRCYNYIESFSVTITTKSGKVGTSTGGQISF